MDLSFEEYNFKDPGFFCFPFGKETFAKSYFSSEFPTSRRLKANLIYLKIL